MSDADARSVIPTMKSSIIKYFNGLCFARDMERPDFVHLLLDPHKVETVDDLGPRALRLLNDKNIPLQLGTRDVELTFEKLSLKHLIAEYLGIPGALVTFGQTELVGHVVIVELHDALLPYKETIGRIIIEKKKPQITAVMNVRGRERSEYRIFPMEVLAKETEDTSLVAEVEAIGCRFRVDFGTVFWNPRRHDQHEAISSAVGANDVMYDVFAGVGPFCIPAAKRGCRVLANDFNPDCTRCLRENALINDVQSRFQCFQQDGLHFIRHTIKEDIISEWRKQDRNKNFHIVMNLPGSSIEFIPAFRDWVADRAPEIRSLDFVTMPYIHLYAFIPRMNSRTNQSPYEESKCKRMLIKMAEYHVGPISEITECRSVTDQGVTRIHRLSFRLPAAGVGLAGMTENDQNK